MALPRFLARMKIYGHRVTPAIRPAVKSLTGAQFWRESGGQDGRRVNVRRVRMDNDSLSDLDLLPGQIPTTAYCLMPNYDIRWYSIGPENFDQTVSQLEKDKRRDALGVLAVERARILAKPNQTDEDQARLRTIDKQLKQLADSGQGFFSTAYNCLGTKAKGVYYGLAVGNVPLSLRFVNTIKPNRAISIRVKRLEPPKEQGNHELAFCFGDDIKRYALVLGRDKEIEWRHYKPMAKADREELERQLTIAQDAGRLTAADEKQIYAWDAEHAKLTEGGQPEDGESKLRLAAIKRLEEKLRDDKKAAGDAAKLVIDRIEKLLYYDRAAVTVPEYIKTTYGFSIDITIEWLRRGGAIITIGNSTPFVWWDKTQTAGNGFVTMLRKRAKFEIKSTGGEFSFALGAPNYAPQAALYGAPFTVPATSGIADFDFVGVCSPPDLTKNLTVGYWVTPPEESLPGVSIAARVSVLKEPVSLPIIKTTLPAIFQTRLDLYSGGDYAAEVYALDFLVTPQLNEFGPLIYDSEQHKDSAGVAHLLDAQIAAHDNNSMVITATYRDGMVNGQRESGLPDQNLGKRVVDISLINQDTGEEWPMLFHGRIDDDSYSGLQSLHASTGTSTPAPGSNPKLEPMPNAGSMRTMICVGVEQFANKKIEAAVAVDGQHVGDAVRLYARLAGLLPEEYANVPEGEIEGLDPIPLPPAGQLPRARPDENTTYLSFMQRLVADHAPSWELTTDDEGLQMRDIVERDRPDLNYSEDAPVDSTLRILKSLMLRQDFSDYINRITVIGAEDPISKQRVHIEESNPHAFDPRFENRSQAYAGDIISVVVGPNETWQTEEQAMLFARDQLGKSGRPPYVGDMTVPYRPDVKEGDKPYVKGRQYVVVRIERAELNSGGKGTDQRMKLFLRLAKDILLPAT